MMRLKNKIVRNILIGAAVLALLGGAYALVMNMSGDEQNIQEPTLDPVDKNTITIFKTEKDNINEIYVKNPSNEFTVARNGENWRIKEYTDIEFSSLKLENYVYDFVSIYAEKEIENTGDLEQYGLASPQAEIEIRMTDGSAASFELGNAVVGGSGYFFRSRADGKIYTIASYKAESILKKINDFRDLTIASADMQALTHFKLIKNGTLIADIRSINDDEAPKFPQMTSHVMTKPRYEAVTPDVFKFEEEGIGTINAVEFIEDNPGDLSRYGLDNPAVVLTLEDGSSSFEISYGNKTEDGKYIYAAVSGKNFVFTQETALYDKVNAFDTKALLYKFAHLINIEKISSVVIEGEGKKHTLELQGEDDNASYYIDGKDAVERAWKQAYQEVIGLVANGFAEHDAVGEPEWIITFNYKDGLKLTANYINYDERNYAIEKDGNAELVILKKHLSNMMDKLDAFAAEPLKEPE